MGAASDPIAVRPGWEHLTPDATHPADAHYASGGVTPSGQKPVGGKWVCFTCREFVEYVGEAVTGGIAAPPQDAPPGGLEADGS